MKAIKNLIISLVVIVAILGVVIIGGYIYVRTTYGIDLFRTAGQLKTLTQAVDETALCPNAYGEEDFADMPDDLMDKYEAMFRTPEIMIATPMGYTIMPVDAVVEIQVDSE